MNRAFKSLFNTTGKILFIVGLVLNICMVFFGVWPSGIYLLLMLLGAGLVSVTKKSEPITITYATVKKSLLIAMVTAISVIFLVVVAFFFSRNYFNKRDTLNEGKEIELGLQQYKGSTHHYPIHLSLLIENNPLRKGWFEDSWGKPYKYSLTNHGTSYTLSSAGTDSKFETEDDLIFKGD